VRVRSGGYRSTCGCMAHTGRMSRPAGTKALCPPGDRMLLPKKAKNGAQTAGRRPGTTRRAAAAPPRPMQRLMRLATLLFVAAPTCLARVPRTAPRRASAPQALLAGATGPLEGTMPSDFSLPEGRSGVILFDGVCNFCNRWVSFVLDNDPDGLFAFASLQSNAGRELLTKCGRGADDLSTLVVIDSEGFHTQSSAALRVAATLKKPALNALAAVGKPVPMPLRDGFCVLSRIQSRPTSPLLC
jgi:predicted DCC family thiol-disulfide oxidoreductase YuxK